MQWRRVCSGSGELVPSSLLEGARGRRSTTLSHGLPACTSLQVVVHALHRHRKPPDRQTARGPNTLVPLSHAAHEGACTLPRVTCHTALYCTQHIMRIMTRAGPCCSSRDGGVCAELMVAAMSTQELVHDC